MSKTRSTRSARGASRRPGKRTRKRPARPSAPPGIKLRKLVVKNVKVLDELELEFPPPRMTGDPDVVVLGSRNGLGKTSVLESCAMLFVAAAAGEEAFSGSRCLYVPDDLIDQWIRAGENEAVIRGYFTVDGERPSPSMRLSREGGARIAGDTVALGEELRGSMPGGHLTLDKAREAVCSLVAPDGDPLLVPPFMYFHSYRRIREGGTELAAMVAGKGAPGGQRARGRLEHSPVSAFKVAVIRAMMGQKGLFEDIDDSGFDVVLERLNALVHQYASGKIGRLRNSDNAIEIRIGPLHGSPSFPFDGLSSGQKEIISTLFLIWHHTRCRPSIVLIDEPELHLNAEWHSKFVRALHQMAPQNQYIIATHSEDVFGSVEPDRRIMLEPGD